MGQDADNAIKYAGGNLERAMTFLAILKTGDRYTEQVLF
jgi:hypothetical protein